MLTAQRFQLSVLAGGKAECWPPISLNTRSPPSTLSLFLTSSSSPSLSEGADSSQRPRLSKRACYSAPSLWDSGIHLCESMTHRTCSHKGLVHSTHPRTLFLCLSLPHTHTHAHRHTIIFHMPTTYLPIEKLLDVS